MSNKPYPAIKINGKKFRMHRLIMEKHLGRLLESNEHIYHKDGDPTNNALENLVLIIKNPVIRKKVKKNIVKSKS